MSLLTGSVRDLKKNLATQATLRARYLSAPAVAAGGLVASAESPAAKTSAYGIFSMVLNMGNYELSIDGHPDKWIISIPDDSLAYDVLSRIVGSVTQTPTAPVGGGNANASTSVRGIVKINKDGVDPIAAVGMWPVANVAALKLLPVDASNQFAILTARGTNEKQAYYWDPASVAADDTINFLVVRPSTLPATGRWIAFIMGLSATAAGTRTALNLISAEETYSLVQNRRARSGLYFDAVSSPRLAGTTGVNFGLLDFTIRAVYQKRDWSPGVTDQIFASHSAGNNRVRLGCSAGVPGGRFLLLFTDGAGVTTTYNLTLDAPLVDGETYHIIVTCDRDGLATLYINASADRDSNGTSVSVSIAGSAAVDIGSGNANLFAAMDAVDGAVFALSCYNRLLSATEALYVTRNGSPEYSDCWGSITGKYTSDFSAGVDGWVNVNGTITGNTDGIGGENDVLLVDTVAATSIRVGKVTRSLAAGKKVKLSYRVRIPSSNVTGLTVFARSQVPSNVGFTAITPAVDTWVTHTEEIILTEAITAIYIQIFTLGGGSGIVTAGDKFYLKNVVIEYPGCVHDWDFENSDPQISSTLVDRADEANNCVVSSSVFRGQSIFQHNFKRLVLTQSIKRSIEVITYAASVNINFTPSLSDYKTLALAGNITFAAINIESGRTVIIRIQGDGSIRNLTWPALQWVGGAAPATLAAGKNAVLTLHSWGTTVGSITAKWEPEP